MTNEGSITADKINGFVFLETLLCTMIIFFICTGNTVMSSYAFMGSFLVLLLFLVGDIANCIWQNRYPNLLAVTIVAFSFFNVLISTAIANEKISFEYLNQYFIFISTILFFGLAEKIKIGRKTVNIIFLFHLIISGIYWYTYIFYPQEYSEYSLNSLTLNFTNPNLTGMFLFLTVLYMVLAVFYYKRFVTRLFFLIVAIFDFSLMYKTESRNVLLAFVLFLMLVVVARFRPDNKFPKFVNFVINIAPILFVPIYLFFINVVIEKGWLDFLVSRGKELDSRVSVWNNFLEKLNGMWLTGNYAKASGNSHNAHMVILCSFGIVVLILVIAFVYGIIKRISANSNTKFQSYCIAAFFAVIFVGFGEGALYSGGLGIYILCGTFLIMANSSVR